MGKLADWFKQLPALLRDKEKIEATTTGFTLQGKRRVQSATRRESILQAREMVANDPRLRQALQKYAGDLTKAGFIVDVSNNQRAQKVADKLFKDLHIVPNLKERIFKTLRDGELYERIYVVDREIQAIQEFPATQMIPNLDGTFEFVQQYSREVITKFQPWEMIYSKWGSSPDTPFGVSILDGTNPFYERAAEGEDDLFVKRKTTAGVRYLHTIKGGSPTDVELYKTVNREVLSNASALAVADIVTNHEVDMKAVQALEPNGRIEDVKHHIASMLAGTPVPSDTIGVPTGMSAEVLKVVLEQYSNGVEALTETWVVDSFIRPLLERAWLLAGIPLERVDYKIYWQYQAILSPTEMGKLADAMLRFSAAGFAPSLIAKMAVRYIPGTTVKELEEAIKDMNDKSKDDQKVDPNAPDDQASPEDQIDKTADGPRSVKSPKAGPEGGDQNVQAKTTQDSGE
jgi:hypothetical protein